TDTKREVYGRLIQCRTEHAFMGEYYTCGTHRVSVPSKRGSTSVLPELSRRDSKRWRSS
ncbi:hypothetical protein K438DRAFT_1566265, partial [Mycena galopus ATCC 62051]